MAPRDARRRRARANRRTASADSYGAGGACLPKCRINRPTHFSYTEATEGLFSVI